MSVEEVGEVRYSAPNVIKWIIPSFSLLSRKKDTRLWSPLFSHCGDDGNSGRVPWVPPGFLGLILRSEDGKETPIQCVRFGIADKENSDICSCDGVWTKGFFIRHFRVSKFVSEEILNKGWIFASDQFRLFCEVVNNQRCHVVNVSAQKENAYGISISAATASSVSSTAAANIKESWRCRLCTLINPVDASNCEACNLPKSIKDKNLGSSEKLISPISNPAIPATNLPLCIICISKERNIAFQPCGHLITCSDCADFRMKYCPLCRKDIQNKLKTFIN